MLIFLKALEWKILVYVIGHLDFQGHLVYFRAICGHIPFWNAVPRKIWQL
jgi:hypothetical protein